jgi:UDP-GlcNAc:undecaprenyl-phosphate GlcNAc-1-phosphate transferase
VRHRAHRSAAIFLYADRLFKAGLLEGSNMAPLVAAITVGICAGFLPHNFNPARIFMGDRRCSSASAGHHDHHGGRGTPTRSTPDLLHLRHWRSHS